MEMNGPTPTMFDMLSAVAGSKPNPRIKCGEESLLMSGEF